MAPAIAYGRRGFGRRLLAWCLTATAFGFLPAAGPAGAADDDPATVRERREREYRWNKERRERREESLERRAREDAARARRAAEQERRLQEFRERKQEIERIPGS